MPPPPKKKPWALFLCHTIKKIYKIYDVVWISTWINQYLYASFPTPLGMTSCEIKQFLLYIKKFKYEIVRIYQYASLTLTFF